MLYQEQSKETYNLLNSYIIACSHGLKRVCVCVWLCSNLEQGMRYFKTDFDILFPKSIYYITIPDTSLLGFTMKNATVYLSIKNYFTVYFVIDYMVLVIICVWNRSRPQTMAGCFLTNPINLMRCTHSSSYRKRIIQLAKRFDPS